VRVGASAALTVGKRAHVRSGADVELDVGLVASAEPRAQSSGGECSPRAPPFDCDAGAGRARRAGVRRV